MGTKVSRSVNEFTIFTKKYLVTVFSSLTAGLVIVCCEVDAILRTPVCEKKKKVKKGIWRQ